MVLRNNDVFKHHLKNKTLNINFFFNYFRFAIYNAIFKLIYHNHNLYNVTNRLITSISTLSKKLFEN